MFFLEPEHQSLQEFLMFLFNGPEWMSGPAKTPVWYQELAPEKKGGCETTFLSTFGALKGLIFKGTRRGT